LDPLHVALVALPLVAVAIGFGIGRRSSEAAERARGLEAELDAERAALERALSEKRSADEELAAAREESERYRRQVVQHFYGTSDQLRSLTLRYRELFEHLASGARELCPEASSALEAGLEVASLGGGEPAQVREDEADTDEGAKAPAPEAAPEPRA
jgi:uncharacterized membrane-anchored protein YhcB (DUF1043 family)